MKYVVIGNSAAAVGCIEGIRSVDRAGSITLISDEPHAAYGRPLISYLLMGRTDLAHMNYRPADFYETMGVTAMLGRRAAEIDAENKTWRQGPDRSCRPWRGSNRWSTVFPL